MTWVGTIQYGFGVERDGSVSFVHDVGVKTIDAFNESDDSQKSKHSGVSPKTAA